MATDIAVAWDAYADEYQKQARLGTRAASYGPDIPDEAELRLLGDLKGKRVLDLGCGGAQATISFAKAGAAAVGVDISAKQLAHGRRLCEAEEVKIELRQSDMADLVFLRADSIDVAFSANAFQYMPDLNRLFRQVHRVLKVGAPLVFSLPHPAYNVLEPTDPRRVSVKRTYFDKAPYHSARTAADLSAHQHTFADIYMGLVRASYRVDLILEPSPVPGAPRSEFWNESMEWLPRTLIVRARKAGN